MSAADSKRSRSRKKSSDRGGGQSITNAYLNHLRSEQRGNPLSSPTFDSYPQDVLDDTMYPRNPQDTVPGFPIDGQPDLRIILPLLIIMSTLLFLLLIFLVCALFFRRQRHIALRDNDGPTDLSREELVDADGGFEGVESRWLESVPEETRRGYRRAREWQHQYPPNSQPTDITLSQFLSIQEKGVSAWSFEPDYEALPNVLVHSRTELTFLPDPSSYSAVQSNLPLPKLNEVYYWEVKLFDFPPGTTVSIGLATKPFPLFRMPGWNRHSVAYHSNGEKSYNYPFTATSCGASLKEADVLGVGYRPRTGTVFFTRNGRKLEDAFIGLTRWNLFPTIGADGPCTLHVNLGQAGFVLIEANVKKWGLAPSVGTLAPPPAYGAERQDILLQAGGASSTPASPPRRSHRLRRPRQSHTPSAGQSDGLLSPPAQITPRTPPPPLTPLPDDGAQPFLTTHSDSSESPDSSTTTTPTSAGPSPRQRPVHIRVDPPDSPQDPQNPPTPHVADIDLRPMAGQPPPAYSPLDAFVHAHGVHIDLPAEVIAAALEGRPSPVPTSTSSERRRR